MKYSMTTNHSFGIMIKDVKRVPILRNSVNMNLQIFEYTSATLVKLPIFTTVESHDYTSFRLFEPREYKLYKKYVVAIDNSTYRIGMTSYSNANEQHKIEVFGEIIDKLNYDVEALPILLEQILNIKDRLRSIKEYFKSNDIDIKIIGVELVENIIEELKESMK